MDNKDYILKKCKNCKKRRRHKDSNAQKCNFCDNFIFSGNEIVDNWLIELNKANRYYNPAYQKNKFASNIY
ncbi:10962_t:CDS:2 [Dentiscutata erythropus]|uniref:10962_t:CDS:1 n=1 Tax=Dentiscutata erythropus TaxID=1348616 RepID=A0A9N9CKH0_9GLOM|nr:10962_t:CDS:2 [Dentiscutata erythropus]